MISRLQSALYGALLPLTALKLILARPRLMFWSAFPLTLTLGLYFWLAAALRSWVSGEVLAMAGKLGWNPSGFAAGALTLVASAVVFLFCAVTFSIGASIVASPFNDRLAEQTERWGDPALPPAPRPSAAGRARLIAIDGMKSVCALIAGIAALLLSWVPALNLIAFASLCFLVTFQYISYPQTRRGQGLGDGLIFLFRHPWASLTFGGVLTVLFAIPLVSCLAIPLAVVGGTLLVARAQPGAPGSPARFALR